jgi:hypothetical protein
VAFIAAGFSKCGQNSPVYPPARGQLSLFWQLQPTIRKHVEPKNWLHPRLNHIDHCAAPDVTHILSSVYMSCRVKPGGVGETEVQVSQVSPSSCAQTGARVLALACTNHHALVYND